MMNPSEKKFFNWVADDLKLLARLHSHELMKADIEFLQQGDFPNSLVFKAEKPHPLSPILEKALEEILKGSVSEDQLAADFASIYLNVTHQASPNESPWIDDDHLERQEPMFEVRNWYLKYNLEVPNWRQRPDDNISLQLIFISHLLEQPQVPVKDICHFLDFHLLRWVDSFADQVFKHADTAFYSCLAPLTAQYMNQLRDLLDEQYQIPRPSKEEIERLTKKETPPEQMDPHFYTSTNGGW